MLMAELIWLIATFTGAVNVETKQIFCEEIIFALTSKEKLLCFLKMGVSKPMLSLEEMGVQYFRRNFPFLFWYL